MASDTQLPRTKKKMSGTATVLIFPEPMKNNDSQTLSRLHTCNPTILLTAFLLCKMRKTSHGSAHSIIIPPKAIPPRDDEPGTE